MARTATVLTKALGNGKLAAFQSATETACAFSALLDAAKKGGMKPELLAKYENKRNEKDLGEVAIAANRVIGFCINVLDKMLISPPVEVKNGKGESVMMHSPIPSLETLRTLVEAVSSELPEK